MDCEYTDGNRRPRTLALEEDVARLQARVQELENPDTTTPSLTLHDPYMQNPQSTTSANLLRELRQPYFPAQSNFGNSDVRIWGHGEQLFLRPWLRSGPSSSARGKPREDPTCVRTLFAQRPFYNALMRYSLQNRYHIPLHT